jgi:short-subunit dehydrogenase
MPVDFVDTTIQEMESIVDINIHSLLRVTHIIAPLMINRYIICLSVSLSTADIRCTANEA